MPLLRKRYAGKGRIPSALNRAAQKKAQDNKAANNDDKAKEQLARMARGVAEHPNLFRPLDDDLARRQQL